MLNAEPSISASKTEEPPPHTFFEKMENAEPNVAKDLTERQDP
jgi:hypothetical protein